MSLSWDDIFEGGHVPTWLRRMGCGQGRVVHDEQIEAVHDLLLGRAGLDELGPLEPSGLLLRWFAGIPFEARFVEHFDKALAKWIARSFGIPILEGSADHRSTRDPISPGFPQSS